LTEKVIGCAFTVLNTLGNGFLEKVYENALLHELHLNGIPAVQQKSIPVRYKGELVGDYVADMIVENSVIVELKACKGFEDIHTAQCLNYLKATGLKRCLLLNFGTPRLGIRRISL
jgi:GxxExxY protein